MKNRVLPPWWGNWHSRSAVMVSHTANSYDIPGVWEKQTLRAPRAYAPLEWEGLGEGYQGDVMASARDGQTTVPCGGHLWPIYSTYCCYSNLWWYMVVKCVLCAWWWPRRRMGSVCVLFTVCVCVCRLLSVLGEEGMCVWGGGGEGGPHCVCACVWVGGGWRKRTGMKSVSIETDPNNPPKRQSTPPPRH